jgi:regulatory protein
VKINSDEELEKALELVENKFFVGANKKPADPAKVGRFLASRGFSSDIVEKVIYDSKFKFSESETSDQF